MIEQDVAAVAATLVNGGGTFYADTLLPFAPEVGYMVGTADGTAAYQADPEALAETMRRVGQEFTASFVGTWVAPDGRVHVDPVEYVKGKARALRLAAERGQLAIYGFAERMALDVTA